MSCQLLRERCDPLRPGASIGHHQLDGGTLTAIARNVNNEIVILSCLHVLQTRRVDIGAEIIQPGRKDGTPPLNKVGTVIDGFLDADGDAAIASVNGRQVDPRVFELDVPIQATGRVSRGDLVVKVGRTSCQTIGEVYHCDFPFPIRYGSPFGTTTIRGFLIKPHKRSRKPLSEPGDSGAPYLLYRNGQPQPTLVGIHTSRSGKLAFACHAQNAFSRLGLKLLNG